MNPRASLLRPGFFASRRQVTDPAQVARRKSRPPAPAVPTALRRRPDPQLLTATKSRGRAAGLDHRLLERLTFGWTVLDQQVLDELGAEAFLERQLDPGQIDDQGLEQALADAFPSLAMSPAELLVRYELQDMGEIPIYELWLATLYRAVYSPRQLFERMVTFWSDHFSIDVTSDFGNFLKPVDDREVVRAHALGKFPDLLAASAHSPAMLVYLTNDSNVAGHPNENYARELMELHTLGVDGGYSQQDVREVARCFTGWTVAADEDAGYDFGRFRFVPELHDDGPKVVLGERIPGGGGIRDGERVLEILAGHPATASFIAGKMLRWVWGYEPTEPMVEDLARVYLDTGGDIPAMLRAGFAWWRLARSTAKLKRPFHLVTSSLRCLFAGLEEPFFPLAALFAAGHLPFNWAPPNGYPDSEGYWSGLVMPRWNYAALMLGFGPESPVTVDLEALDPQQPPEQTVAVLDALMLAGTMTDATRGAVTAYLASRPADARTLGEAIGLVVASPEFQAY